LIDHRWDGGRQALDPSHTWARRHHTLQCRRPPVVAFQRSIPITPFPRWCGGQAIAGKSKAKSKRAPLHMGASNRLPFASSSASCGRLRGGGRPHQPASSSTPWPPTKSGTNCRIVAKQGQSTLQANIENRNRCKGPVHHRPLIPASCCFAQSIDEPEAFHPPTQAGGIASSSFVAGFFTPSSAAPRGSSAFQHAASAGAIRSLHVSIGRPTPLHPSHS